jgi:hypothetical protein
MRVLARWRGILPRQARRANGKNVYETFSSSRKILNMRGTQMEQKNIVKQMIQYNKTVFDTTFNSMAMLQDQMEKTTSMFLEQASWLPADGKKVVEEWLKAYRKGRENFKSTVDESFKKVETFFAEASKG